MTGFGLYETLRLVIPGAVAVAVVTLVLRLATGEGTLLADGPFSHVIAGLQGTSFLFAALVVGFVLYLVDLPSRARLFSGDPDNGIRLPTDELREILKGTAHEKKAFSLYFILSDGRLPPELHRRIYFFGGLYRIYFDTRVLAAAGVAIGAPLALAVHGHGNGDWIRPQYWISAAVLILLVAIMTLVGESRHAVESMRKHAPPGVTYPAPGLWSTYLGRAVGALREILIPAIVVLMLGVGAAFLSDAGPAWLRTAGVASAICALILWIMVELGPPAPVTNGTVTVPGGPVRGRVLSWLKLEPSSKTQYTQLQRGLMDVALLSPALMAAASAAQQQGREAILVLCWAALVVPATLIMAIRKHEQRLLASYKDQVRWLEINHQNIRDLAENGPQGEWF